MPEEQKQEQRVNKVKIYVAAILLFVLGNFLFEIALTLLENQLQTFLYPIFPFTRIYLLIITILVANYYIRRKQGKPKQKLWWCVFKAIILLVIAWLFFFGAWFSLSESELERMRQNRPDIPSLEAPTKAELEATYEAN